MMVSGHAFAGNILWANRLISFSSQYGNIAYSAKEALGPPSRLPTYGDCGCAWSPSAADNFSDEFIRVGFAERIHVTQIIVSENFNSGAIKAIYLYDAYNLPHLVYERKKIEHRLGEVFSIVIPPTDYTTNDLKLILDTQSIDGFNQIDAIGISDSVNPLPTGNISVTDMISFTGPAENMGDAINSYGSEIAPMATPDGKTLYFTRKNHPGNMGTVMNDDIWVSDFDGNAWSEAANIGSPVNNNNSNYVVGISDGGTMLTLANTYDINGSSQIGISQTWQTKNGSWHFPLNLITPGLLTIDWYAEYFMNEDRSVLLMALNKGGGFGQKDIYVSFSNNQVIWTVPVNLGPDVNTVSNEIAPFLAPDGKTLFYSSNGFPGYGDEDIFVTRRLDDSWQHWSKPENLGKMVNTAGFDAYFTYPDSADYAFFSSAGDANLNVDIYRIPMKEVKEKKDSVVAENTPDEHIENFEDNSVVPDKENITVKLSNDVLLFGTVYDSISGNPVDADLIFSLSDYASTPVMLNTLNHNYRLKVTDSISYDVNVIKKGYLPLKTTIVISGINTAQNVKRIDFRITPVHSGEKFILNNLYFDANKSEIKPESTDELDLLYAFLLSNPDIEIEIGGHTNGLCSEDFCLKLSRDRAEAVKKFLVAKGIDEDRISAVGYGSRFPIASNATAEGRKKNQRVEITVQ